MARTNFVLMLLLIALSSVIAGVVFFQRPLDLTAILGAGGFALLTFGWTGMYFRLKREMPQHGLVDAMYLNLPRGFGQRRAGLDNVVRLIRLHFARHRVDVWSTLLIAGLGMLAASLIGSAV
jgi:hypothetical protein